MTTPATPLCYRPQVTVWVDKHSDLKSQVMATLEMARSGPVISVWEVVRFNMADSTSQQTGFNRLSAVETSKALTRSASGVTGVVGMEQWWWLMEEEIAANVQITGFTSYFFSADNFAQNWWTLGYIIAPKEIKRNTVTLFTPWYKIRIDKIVKMQLTFINKL